MKVLTLKRLILSLGLAVLPLGVAAEEARVTIPLADYVKLTTEARNRSVSVTGTAIERERLRVWVEEEGARFESRLEIEVRRGLSPVLVPVTGLVKAVEVQPAAAAGLGRTQSGHIELVPLLEGRCALRFESELPFAPEAEAVSFDPGGRAAPVAEVAVDLPAAFPWKWPGAVVLEERVVGARRELRLVPPAGTVPFTFERGKRVEAPTALVARSVVISHVSLRADETLRLETVLFEVLRGGLATLEVKRPPVGELVRAWMDDGGEVEVVGDRLVGRRKQKLAGNGYLKVLLRLPEQASGRLDLPALEPDVAPRARYLVVSSARTASFRTLPEGRFSSIDLTDPPDVLAAELAERPPVAGWRFEGAAAGAGLEVAVLPAVAVVPEPITERRSTTFVNPDGSVLVHERFVFAGRHEALALTLPASLSFQSATVGGAVVRPVERGGRHLVPLPFRAEGSWEVEVALADSRPLRVKTKKLEHRFELPQVEGEVLRHSWLVRLPAGVKLDEVAGTLREVRRSAKPGSSGPCFLCKREERNDSDDPMIWTVDGVVITDMGAIGSSPSYYNFDSFEGTESVEGVITVTGESPILDERKVRTGTTLTQQELEKIPTARDPWVILQQTPGVLVDRLNVGGNESNQSSFQSPGSKVQVRLPEPPIDPNAEALLLSAALPPSRVYLELTLKRKK